MHAKKILQSRLLAASHFAFFLFGSFLFVSSCIEIQHMSFLIRLSSRIVVFGIYAVRSPKGVLMYPPAP